MHIAPNDKGATNNGADYGDAAKQDRHQQRIVGLVRKEQVPRLQNPLPRLCKHALILARRAIWKYASQYRLNFKLETLPKVRAVEKLAPFELVARKAAKACSGLARSSDGRRRRRWILWVCFAALRSTIVPSLQRVRSLTGLGTQRNRHFANHHTVRVPYATSFQEKGLRSPQTRAVGANKERSLLPKLLPNSTLRPVTETNSERRNRLNCPII